MMRILKKLVLVALSSLLAFSVLGSLAACDTGKEKGGNTLSVWTVAPILYNYETVLKANPKDKQANFTKDIIEKFEKENDANILLDNKGFGDELNKVLMPMLNSGRAADIVPGEMYLKAYYKSGKYQELNFSKELMDDFIPQVHDTMRYNGKVYGVPIQTGVMALNINKKALREFGVIDSSGNPTAAYEGLNPLAPQTWEDLLAICQKIDSSVTDDKGGMLLSKTTDGAKFRLLPIMRTAGGEIVDDNNAISMDTPQNEKAFKMIRDLVATSPEGAINAQNEDSLHSFFWNSKAAYMVEGSDIVARRYRFEKNFTDVYKEVIATELPVFEGVNKKSNVLVGSLYFSITESCKNKELAMKFLNYLLSDYVQEKLVASDYRIPIRKSIIEKEMAKTDGNALEMKSFFNAVMGEDYSFKGGLPDFEKNSSDIWSKFNVFLGKLYGTGDNLGTLLDTAQKDMTEMANK